MSTRVFKTYNLDMEKLQSALLAKQKSHRISRGRLAERMKLSESTLKFSENKGIHSRVLVNILMYLKRPITDFVYEEDLEDDNNR